MRAFGGDWVACCYTDREFEKRPTIADYAKVCPRKALQLVQCDNGESKHHTFAIENMKVVDVDTQGEVKPFVGPLPGYEKFRVSRVFFIFGQGQSPPDLASQSLSKTGKADS